MQRLCELRAESGRPVAQALAWHLFPRSPPICNGEPSLLAETQHRRLCRGRLQIFRKQCQTQSEDYTVGLPSAGVFVYRAQ